MSQIARIMIVAATSLPFSGWTNLVAADFPNNPTLVIKLEGTELSAPIPVIYVKGERAGSIPGYVKIPLEDDKPIPIEIGIPQINRAPLYSFTVGQNNLDQGSITVVSSDIYYISGSYKKEETDTPINLSFVYLNPNTSVNVPLDFVDGVYSITLPKKGYNELLRLWKEHSSYNWLSRGTNKMPPQNDSSYRNGIYHSSYDKSNQSVMVLTGQVDAHWSGAESVYLFDTYKKAFKISSVPSGATIVNEEGAVGTTDLELQLQITSNSYMFIKKDGYLDCPFEKCAKTMINDKTDVQCKLEPVTKILQSSKKK